MTKTLSLFVWTLEGSIVPRSSRPSRRSVPAEPHCCAPRVSMQRRRQSDEFVECVAPKAAPASFLEDDHLSLVSERGTLPPDPGTSFDARAEHADTPERHPVRRSCFLQQWMLAVLAAERSVALSARCISLGLPETDCSARRKGRTWPWYDHGTPFTTLSVCLLKAHVSPCGGGIVS